jgi:lipopolysaccharide biosynthesis protein
MIAKSLCTVLCHTYYSCNILDVDPNLTAFERVVINDSSEQQQVLAQEATIQQVFYINTPNKGKDIGGKLALIDAYLSMGEPSDFIVMLHDKKSPHSPLGKKWKNDLFQIINPQNLATIQTLFADEKVGVVGAKNYIKNEYQKEKGTFATTNNFILKELMHQYALKPQQHWFVAGTMFWIRSSILERFFSLYEPLDIRKGLETGNMLDTYSGTVTHAWERLFCWIAQHYGYTIKGI